MGLIATYYQVGFSKCATTSLAHYFQHFGTTTHNDPNVWVNLYINFIKGKQNILENLPEGMAHFDFMMCNDNFDLLEDYVHLINRLCREPRSRFIFNYREKEAWILSKTKQLDWIKDESADSVSRYHQMLKRFFIKENLDLDLEHFSMRKLARLEKGIQRARLSHFFDQFMDVFREHQSSENWLFLDIDEDIPKALHDRWGLTRHLFRHLNKSRK